MKKFLALTLTVLLLTVAALSFTLSTTAAAEKTNPSNVIFISDNYSTGDGSGRDAQNPLRPVAVDDFFVNEVVEYDANGNETNRYGKYYLKTPLYQAAEKLVDTGGTIVICGPLSINGSNSHGSSANYKDYQLPTSMHEITITSKYDGVDYSKAANGGAYLEIAAPSYLMMGSPSVFEYITIRTAGANRALCASGNKIVMGDGINCTLADPSVDASGNGGSYYLSIAGGKRYGDFEGDSDITIKSGYYYCVAGSTWGVSRNENVKDEDGNNVQQTDSSGNPVWKTDSNDEYVLDEKGEKIPVYLTETAIDVQKGNVSINLLGGTFRGTVCGASTFVPGVSIDGDVYINVEGNASLRGWIYVACNPKFASAGCKAYVRIAGGSHSVAGIYETKTNSGTLNNASVPSYQAECTLDISNDAKVKNRSNPSDNTALLTKYITSWNGEELYYPNSWITSVSCNGQNSTVKPITPSKIISGEHSAEGVAVSVTYNNKAGTGTVTRLVKYDERNTSFTQAYDLNYNSNGTIKKLAKYIYGGKQYQSAFFDEYVETPAVELLGARLKTEGDKQGLRFVGKYTAPSNAKITEAGVMALKSYMINDTSKLNLDETFGNVKYVAAADDIYTETDGKIRFECEIGTVNQREFIQDYTARGYVKYLVDGVEYVSYSDVIVRNPYDMAKAAVGSSTVEDSATVSHLNTKLISVANNYSNANQYVSDEELDALRKSVVDYMELMANIKWTPEQSFAMYNNTGDTSINDVRYQNNNGTYVEGVNMSGIFEKGKYYYGMPYTSSSVPGMQTSNFESFDRLMELTYAMDNFTAYNGQKVPHSESDWNYTGKLNWLLYSKKDSAKFVNWMYYNLTEAERDGAYVNYTIIPGSHCSKSVFSAWNLVLNNSISTSRLTATYRVVPGSNSNVTAVGGYNYKGITEQNNTREIIESNGVVFNTNESGGITSINYEKSDLSVMYNAYKSCKPGDGLIHYTDSGHTRMVVDVTYNSANPGKSIVKTIECANWTVPHLRMSDPQSATAGVNLPTEYDNNSCWKVREYSFDNLLITTYIPSRISELTTGLVDELSVVMTDTEISEGKFNGTVRSNMQIVSLDVTVSGNGIEKNEVIYLTSEAMHLSSYDITKLDLATRFGLTEGSTYNVTLKVGTPGTISGYTTSTEYPNDVDNDDRIATGYTPTFTTIWENMPFVAEAVVVE